MPYIVTSGSHFRPFTYDDLVKPLAQMAEAQNAVAEHYDNVAMETEALRQYLQNEPDDSRARSLYDSYTKQLESLQNDLWANGYNNNTRRGLGVARQMYASNIDPLKKAIQNRMDRSNEYWEARHKNSDLVTGSDPGLASLDSYLGNENYGKDWFSYSGNQFASEVGADVKAYANGLLRSGEVPEGSAVADQLVRVRDKGFRADEVDHVRAAVSMLLHKDKNAADAIESLTNEEQILFNVLTSHLESTGATKAGLSEDELGRLVNYGANALSYGVLGKEMQYFEDPDAKMRRQIALMREQNRLSKDLENHKAALKGAQQKAANSGYSWMVGKRNETSPGYEEYESKMRRFADKYKDGKTYNIVDTNDQMHEVGDYWTMADLFYNPKIRQDMRIKYNGLDILADLKSDFIQFGQNPEPKHREFTKNINGKDYTFYIEKMDKKTAEDRLLDPDTAVYVRIKGEGDKGDVTRMSEEISKAREEAYNYVESMKAANEKNYPDLIKNLDDYAPSPEFQYGLRRDNEVPSNMNASNMRGFMNTKYRVASYTPATLVDHTDAHKVAREAFAGQIYQSWKNNNTGKKGVGKGSHYAFYEVGPNGITPKEKGETSAATVFGTKKVGNNDVVNYDTLTSITLSPREVAKGANGGRPQAMITTAVDDNKRYLIDAEMLGDEVYNQLTYPLIEDYGIVASLIDGYNVDEQQLRQLRDTGRLGRSWSNCDLVDFIETPILHPSKVEQMTPAEVAAWIYACKWNIPNPPMVAELDGTKSIASPYDIINSPSLKEWLEDSVRMYIDGFMSIPRESVAQRHMQSVGMNSSNAVGLLED